MDALKGLIGEKKRKLAEIAVEAKGGKMIKMADLIEKQREERRALYGSTKTAEPTEKPDEEAERAATSTTVVDPAAVIKEEKELPRAEVVRRLRSRGEPILLFGESHMEAQRRLRKLEFEQPELKEGWKNEFQAALRKVDDEFVEEVIKGANRGDQRGKHDVNMSDTTAEVSFDKIATDSIELAKMSDPHRDCDVIHAFIVHILNRWGKQLNAREESIKRSPAGKLEAGTHRQTMENLKPLITQLKTRTCNNDIRCHLCKIVALCVLDRDYVQANNAYMEMAIGNAPWPVGVTRSGIHQRPGSAKSYVSNIAHVLNDETQRKYIHGLKRIITKCQDFYATDPSKCVEYVPKKT
ncbi:PRP18-like protein [Aphelenchoides fujianensis]|nr:PRP18-like protein [Aphelenchoides fujianensis]